MLLVSLGVAVMAQQPVVPVLTSLGQKGREMAAESAHLSQFLKIVISQRSEDSVTRFSKE